MRHEYKIVACPLHIPGSPAIALDSAERPATPPVEKTAATARRPPSDHRRRSASAFTLIELLVAVTVLVVMTLLLTRIISQSNTVITEGTKQATQNANARMALDFLAREFSQAGGDGRLKFQRNTSGGSTYSGTFPCHELRFATFKNVIDIAAPNYREAVLVRYFVKDLYASAGYYTLMRGEKRIGNSESYTNRLYSSGDEVELIRYVVEFRAVCHDTNATASIMDSGQQDHLPVYMDVYLSVLSEVDAKRAQALGDGTAAQRNYIFSSAKRYHTRCWSLNRTAYLNGR